MNLEEEYVPEVSLQLIQKFISALKQQMLCPELLAFEKQLFKILHGGLKDQEDRIKQYLKDEEDDNTSRQEKSAKYLIYKSQTQKINYILKEYLRVRLQKIQKFAFYLLKNQAQAERLLSESQLQFMKKFADHKYKYLEENVLKNLVKNYRGLGGLEVFFNKSGQNKLMLDTQQSRVDIVQPNLDAYVFAKIEGNPQMVRFNYDIEAKNIEGQPVVRSGCTVYAPYRSVMALIQQSNAYLI